MNKQMKYKCVITSCSTNGYAVSVDGKGDISWPLCSEHFKTWGYFLAGAETNDVIKTHTPKFNITMERYLAYCNERTND